MMRPRTLLLACLAWLVLSSANAVSAQSQGAANGAISGTWTGTLGSDETRVTSATFELKSDGKGAVSGVITGPQLSPGDVKAGTFDAKTGALKFAVVLRDDGNGTINFEGAIVRDTLTARASADDSRQFILKLTKRAAGESAAARPPAAQPAIVSDTTLAAVRRSFVEVSGWVTRAATLVPADKYSYRPTPTVRTFGQLVGHIADAYNFYCGRAAGREVQWSEAIEKGTTDKAALAQKLKQSLDACHATYAGGARQPGALVENVAHTNLHYGNIVTYIRMLGLAPPSS